MAFFIVWGPAKARTNRAKHGITFEEAATVFADPAREKGTMNKDVDRTSVREFDFRGGVRGKYAARFPGANVVILEPDLAGIFRDSRAVNGALRAYREQQVSALIAELEGKPSRARQKAVRARLRKLGHRGGLRGLGSASAR